MPLTKKQFIEYLTLYGRAIEDWPVELRADGMRAVHHPDFAPLIEKQRRFEMLLQNRPVETARPGMADRIIASANPFVRRSGTAWFVELLTSYVLLPKPAFTLAVTLMLGIAIGFSLPSGKDDASMQTYFEDYGATL